MSEHHTQGRQGQGARHNRRYRSRSNRNHRQRMPRPDEGRGSKPSLFKRILAFFGFGKKKDKQNSRKKNRSQEQGQKAPQRVRVAQTNKTKGGNAPAKGRRRASSVLPTEQARLYVGNLSFEATEAELEDLFKGFGHVRSVEIIYNSRTYRSKGYAFVEMEQLADAQRAAEVLHGQPFMGRELMVSAASEKAERAEEDETPKQPAAPRKPEEKEEPQDEIDDVTFGEEVVVNLTPETPAAEPAPAAETPAEGQNA